MLTAPIARWENHIGRVEHMEIQDDIRTVLQRKNPVKRLLIILPYAVLLWSTVCLAGDYDDGLAAYLRGDYKTALALLAKAASKGEDKAQLQLGFMYFHGQGVAQDYRQAEVWIRKAADQGNQLAQMQLSDMYRDGTGVPQDDSLAVLWIRKVANQGDPMVQVRLGEMYREGRGVAQDYNQALLLFRKAADQGLGMAQHLLGMMYENGEGIPQNYIEAYKWYNLALAEKNRSGIETKGLPELAIKGRDRAAEKIKEAQIQARQSQKPNMKACITGPQDLRQVDEWERKNYVADVKQLGFDTPEQLAESYIGDCSYVIGVLSLASMDKSTISLMQTNLDYMKWWLQNRRDKKK
jgi:TPR repeat protein